MLITPARPMAGQTGRLPTPSSTEHLLLTIIHQEPEKEKGHDKPCFAANVALCQAGRARTVSSPIAPGIPASCYAQEPPPLRSLLRMAGAVVALVDRQISFQFPAAHVQRVFLPFNGLGFDKTFKDMLAHGFAHQVVVF
jgi:hypothetical protein